MPQTKGHRRRMRRIKPHQAERAIWIDFEGTTTDDPSMLGVLQPSEGTDRPQLTQYVFDEGLAMAAEASSQTPDHRIVVADLETTLRDLVERSDAEGRHLVAWSLHDYNFIAEQVGRVAVRYRNAIPTARRWRNQRSQLTPDLPSVEFPSQELQRYLDFVGYERDIEYRSDAATHIRTVRERSATQSSWSAVSDGGKDAWRRLVQHNRHDLVGMQRVVRLATGLDEPGLSSN